MAVHGRCSVYGGAMTKSAQEILAEWADPETGGTMPREVREAALSVLAKLEEAEKELDWRRDEDLER